MGKGVLFYFLYCLLSAISPLDYIDAGPDPDSIVASAYIPSEAAPTPKWPIPLPLSPTPNVD
ncbi:MAG: hypothetical protein K6B65_05200 [Bacilli bacterium]|nr:hypothetical protein [Bacilli bacterium]